MTRSLLLAAAALPALPGLAAAQDVSFGLAPLIQYDVKIASDVPEPFRARDDDLNLARVYLTASRGDLSATLAYQFEDTGFVKYAFVSYDVTDALRVTAGQQDEPFSLVDLQGAAGATFFDGAQSTALQPGDNIGVRVTYIQPRHTLSAGVYGGDFLTGFEEEGVAVSARGTVNSDPNAPSLGHLGLGLSTRSGADLQAGLSQGVGAGLIPRSVLQIGGDGDVERISRVNLEAAWRRGPLSLQAEATGAMLDREGAEDDEAYGAYATASWLLTGEVRPYSGGVFGQIEPSRDVFDGGRGAWEVAARLDGADLGEDGRLGRATAAVNWHLSRAVRVGVDLSRTEVEDDPLGLGDVTLVFARVQYAH